MSGEDEEEGLMKEAWDKIETAEYLGYIVESILVDGEEVANAG